MYKALTYCCCFVLVLGAVGCKKDIGPVVSPPVIDTIPGGKGGKKHIAIFPIHGDSGVTGKVYIKYGSKTVPSSYKVYDDSSATMVEPGFGPHAHFLSLKAGFYAISAFGELSGKMLRGDTVIEIKETQPPSVDYDITLK